MQPIGVLIVEPKATRRSRFMSWLSTSSDFSILGAGRDLVEACQANTPPSPVDVLLISLGQTDTTWLEGWALIHGLLPSVRVVGLAKSGDDLGLLAALAGGVLGLHPVDAGPDVIRRAVQCAARGIVDIDGPLAGRVKESLIRSPREWLLPGSWHASDRGSGAAFHEFRPYRLTDREQEVLKLVSLGFSNGEVASHLHLSGKTVRNVVSAILEKLEFRNRTQAARWFLTIDTDR